MIKRILVSSDGKKIVRTAFVNGKNLINFDIDCIDTNNSKYNIYKGYVTRIESSLNAVFVDYGETKQGFLPYREISSYYFKNGFNVSKNDSVLVQVTKEERNGKGVLLTTFISLVGNYLILLPNNSLGGGISKKITITKRNFVKKMIDGLDIPKGMSVIARTACVGKLFEELAWDLNILLTQWNAVRYVSKMCLKPFLVYRISGFYTKIIQEYAQTSFYEIIIDNLLFFKEIVSFFELVRPNFVKHVKLYNERVPLFMKFKIEKQITSVFANVIQLPSGGSIKIDYTEALISIDVNSSKAVTNTNIEETALQNNLEAVCEITKQLRLRDVGGIIVIDFIDMFSAKNRTLVEKKMLVELVEDKAKIKVGSITKFGLLELSRQRTRRTLNFFSENICTNCLGKGTTMTPETMSMLILQSIYEEAQCMYREIIIEISDVVFLYIINNNKKDILNIEVNFAVKLFFVCKSNYTIEQYKIYKQKNKNINVLKNMCISAKDKNVSAFSTIIKSTDGNYLKLKFSKNIFDSFMYYLTTNKIYSKLKNKLISFLKK